MKTAMRILTDGLMASACLLMYCLTKKVVDNEFLDDEQNIEVLLAEISSLKEQIRKLESERPILLNKYRDDDPLYLAIEIRNREWANYDPENERRALRSMLDSDVDGVIVEPTKSGLPNPNLDFYTEFRKRGIPVLFFNAKYPELDFPVVSLDDAAAGEIAASFLIGNGHRDIAGIFQCDDIQGKLRYKGYMKALSENGIAINSRRILWYATEDISELTRYPDRILRRLEGCSAVCCYNDRIAVSVIDVLKQNGRSVPGDMSVVGIDNSSLADLCSPPLTSVYNPAALLGETAAKNLLAMIENPDFDAQVLFRPVMVERASVSVYTAQRTAREDEDESKHAQAVL